METKAWAFARAFLLADVNILWIGSDIKGNKVRCRRAFGDFSCIRKSCSMTWTDDTVFKRNSLAGLVSAAHQSSRVCIFAGFKDTDRVTVGIGFYSQKCPLLFLAIVICVGKLTFFNDRFIPRNLAWSVVNFLRRTRAEELSTESCCATFLNEFSSFHF